MTHLGTLALYLASVLAVYAIVTSLWGVRTRRTAWIASGTQAAYAVSGCVVIASIALLHALLTRDFNVEYVASYSSSTLPLHYTVAAFWGGQKGLTPVLGADSLPFFGDRSLSEPYQKPGADAVCDGDADDHCPLFPRPVVFSSLRRLNGCLSSRPRARTSIPYSRITG